MFFLPFIILLTSYSSVYGQWKAFTLLDVGWGWEIRGVHFTSADEGWAVGAVYPNPGEPAKGLVLHYKYGAWAPVTPLVDLDYNKELYGVHFTSATEGWAVGAGPSGFPGLYKYQNGLWTPYYATSLGQTYLYGVHFTSADEGWAVGHSTMYGGVLLHYQGGAWTSVACPIEGFCMLNGVHFTSATEGWAVGYGYDGSVERGVLLHYQNGTWTDVKPSAVFWQWKLHGVHFTSATEGWAVGYGAVDDSSNWSGVLLHYQNGTWKLVTAPASTGSYRLNGVHFTSADEGWAVGEDLSGGGILLHYQGGAWAEDTPSVLSATSALHGVHFTSATEGWAVGKTIPLNRRGIFFRYSLSPLSYDKGTIGTRLYFLGSQLGTNKGKVLVGNAATKIISWSDSFIDFEIKKTLSLGPSYAVEIKPKGADTIILQDAFIMMAPEIVLVDPPSGSTPDGIRVLGNFFGTKKGKVYLEYEQGARLKKKNCKVMSWGMDSITFSVPKTSKSFPPGTYRLKVVNKVGIAEAPSDFTIEPSP
jgi:hypothetical protein